MYTIQRVLFYANPPEKLVVSCQIWEYFGKKPNQSQIYRTFNFLSPAVFIGRFSHFSSFLTYLLK